jgi:hypothetical protein
MLTRNLSRRGAMAGLATLTGYSLTRLDARAKRKKKKKKKKAAIQCKPLAQACSGDCCAGLSCEDRAVASCPAGNHCCAGVGGNCQDSCHCCGGLNCSERESDTCQNCGFVGTDCPNGNDDCCSLANSCGAVTKAQCNVTGNVCCGNKGASCLFTCECCGDMRCSERTETCQDCAFVRESCNPGNGDSDCCLVAGTCGTVSKAACGISGDVCCQRAGAGCNEDCDCCGALLCTQQQCVVP